MALIVVQHNVVDNFDVDPNYSISSSGRILAGMLVGIDTNGYVQKSQHTAVGVLPLGIAGDSISDEYKTTAYSADLVINPKGAKRWTSNRVSDFYNETLASSKMTVYVGSGRFATDQYVLSDTWTGTQGAKVYSNSVGLFTTNSNSSAARPVGYVVAPPTDYPSGVPGVDSPAVENSMSLGKFLTVHLSI
jgi:hypothetical protein